MRNYFRVRTMSSDHVVKITDALRASLQYQACHHHNHHKCIAFASIAKDAMDDEDAYGDIADEDLIDAFSQEASQTLPLLPRAQKRPRTSDDFEDGADGRRRKSRKSAESGVSGDEEENPRAKKNRHRIVIGDREVPEAKILGATQAEALEALPDSSPYRIRGPIYKKPRDPPPPLPLPGVSALRRASPVAGPSHRRTSNGSQMLNESFGDDFEDIPSDILAEFNEEDFILVGSSSLQDASTQEPARPRQRLIAPQQGLRQTTLFGHRAPEEVPASQVKKVYNFIVDKPPESPTHHKLDPENLKTWVYPLNLGKIRDYQYSIVRHALFNNTLVALPTGLGKTCIAATVMFNYYRWTKDAQIVFVAPTKPLVAQQVDACFNIVGIPKSQTTMLTGEQAPALRAEEWQEKRVFFMTPQTFDNDLRSGLADPKKIVLLVVDEAHRAKGNYAYVNVVTFLRRFNTSFRVLALTATPGASVEAVQEVIDNLEISKVEIRTEESIDIQQYVHTRNIDQILLDPSDEIILVKESMSKCLQPLVSQLCGQNAYYNRDPMALTTFGMMQARKTWFASPAGRAAPMPVKGMMNALFSVLASVAHSIKLLNFHGIASFYDKIKDFRQGSEDAKQGGGKYKKQVLQHPQFMKMMDRIQMWLSHDDFVGHPKLTYLCDTVLNHFLDAGDGRLGEDCPPSSTRVIVFSEYRDSAENITKVLNRHGPLIRASVFVGQADSKRSEGMKQAAQIETIEKFKQGKINVLVATSIGEEGLDIGQVDLIVCYDASGSPIRMLQRMGRTGRKRAGKIVLLLMRGKEEESFAKAKDNYEQMQKMISSGTRFNFRHDLSARILPRDIVPEVDKRIIDIPLENTQDPSLPEPKRRLTKLKKKPPKKFHMPDGVVTGFQKASKLGAALDKVLVNREATVKPKVVKKPKEDELAPILPVESVFLSASELKELQRRYLHVSGPDMQEVELPDLSKFPATQRSLGPTVNVQHGQYTKRCVKLFSTIAKTPRFDHPHKERVGEEDMSQLMREIGGLVEKEPKARISAGKKRPTQKTAGALGRNLALENVSDGETATPKPRKAIKKARKRVVSRPVSDSEGEGDNLLNSEELSEDDSDSGESLQDFVVGDHQSTGLITSPLVQSSMTPYPSHSSPTRNLSNHKKQTLVEIDSSDDEMANIGVLRGTTKVIELGSGEDDEDDEEEEAVTEDLGAEDEEDEDEEVIRPVKARIKKRMVVADSESEDE